MHTADKQTIRPTIRPLEPADVPALLHIIAEARHERPDASDRDFYASYQRQRTLYFVAVLDGEVVGGAGVAPLSAADPLTCELQGMYLRPDARHRGIGHALLERCIVAAKQFLYVRCYLETATDMQEAVEFYGRHGFQDLQAPPGQGVRRGGERWMMRALRASARATISPVAPALLASRAPHEVVRA
jgi:putative acetyltransferase